MHRLIILLLLFGVTAAAVCDTNYDRVSEPFLPVSLRSIHMPALGEHGFFSVVQGPVFLSEDGRRLVDNAVFWNWMSIGGFGASTLGLIISQAVDKTVGGMLSLVSVGFWTVTNLSSALTHRNIGVEIKLNDSDVPGSTTAGIASLVGGILGAGTMTAISLTFGDASGAAAIAAYVCFGLSTLAGGYGIFKTFEYAAAAGADLTFF
jgi:predicted ABC-type sugar transport system permease subunit